MKTFFYAALPFVVLLILVAPVAAQTPLDSPLPGTSPEPPAPEDMTVETILLWIVKGGCAVVVSWALERFAREWFHGQTPENKAYIAFGLSGLVACLAFAGLVGLNVEDNPGTLLAWVDTLLPVFFVGGGSATLAHAVLVLRGKPA